ncbi:MAG TPA: hypothetical protein VER11_32270 [Polyangiaceae bacterium]|nr:hypothetical protein [Polyangiaceae bacterium]
MTRELFFCLLAIALCAPAGACSGGTETGNPPFQAELSYTAYSSMPSLISVREQSSQAVVESAWLDLDSVSLIGADGCAEVEPRSLSVPALGIGDHASGQHNATVFFAAGSDYCALELPFALAPPSGVLEGVPADLARHSIMLAGALADGTRFTLLSAATPRVRLSADSGSFEISKNAARTLVVFDVAEWLADLDWAEATRVDGEVRISADDNPALLARFERNLARGIALYRDADGDGKLDEHPVRLAHGE